MKYLLTILIICLAACNRGTWISSDAYRPKNAKFSVSAKSFRNSSLIDNNNLYMLNRPFLNYDNKVFISFVGFYADGNLIFNSAEQEQLVAITQKNSLQTASIVGRYTTQEENITIELFLPADGGTYHRINGLIKKDTIILFKNINMLFKKERRYDTLIKSSFSLR